MQRMPPVRQPLGGLLGVAVTGVHSPFDDADRGVDKGDKR